MNTDYPYHILFTEVAVNTQDLSTTNNTRDPRQETGKTIKRPRRFTFQRLKIRTQRSLKSRVKRITK